MLITALGQKKPGAGLLLLRNADGGPLCDGLVHLLGGEQRPNRHASKTPRHWYSTGRSLRRLHRDSR
jgi:hypothetical protein